MWSLPGGVLETGETLVEGVVREVLEETGLMVRADQPVEIFERIMRDETGKPEYHYVLVDFICRVIGGSLAAADDVSDVRWTPKQDLENTLLTEGTLPVIEKAYSILLCSAPAPNYSNTRT
jgi:ADP-ribose pyrophosphatase YjhB (NUDIX family)